jgi:electron transfer flavoprotein beta subunit
MKILVPIKRVVDPNVKVRVMSDESGIDLNNTKMTINPFCEIAIEQAIRLKESGDASEVIAVTIGATKSEEQLRTALALGADRAIHLVTDLVIEPLTVARLLATVVEKEQPELVIFGKQSIDGDNNQTAQMLAALTDRPQGTFISKLSIEGNELKITREVDNGLELLALQLPAVLSADLRLNEPRFASLPNIMKAKRKPIDKIDADSLGVDLTVRVKVLKTVAPAVREAGKMVASVTELIEKLNLKEGAV